MRAPALEALRRLRSARLDLRRRLEGPGLPDGAPCADEARDPHSLARLAAEAEAALASPSRAEALRLRYVRALSWREVARALGYSLPTVYRLHRAALRELSVFDAGRGKVDSFFAES